ncbi:hypothetical protein GCM10022215_14270 [Nocardioides fonticola]|uniref:Uncharacterized protein n=1 Tax=Nocardioides fonticola TaxID=450363 RepID=A0ABP7XG23_9ACTN
MPSTTAPRSTPPTLAATTRTGVIRAFLVVVGTGLIAGALTSWAQGVLPDSIGPLANSISGWTIVVVAAVAAVRPGPRAGAALGVAAFLALLLGYTLAAAARGLSYDPTLWGVLGVLAGPMVGAAAAALVEPAPLRRGLGAGAIAGLLAADGVRGLTVLAATTSPVWWWCCLAGAAALLVATAARIVGARSRLLMLATAAGIAAALSLGLRLLG